MSSPEQSEPTQTLPDPSLVVSKSADKPLVVPTPVVPAPAVPARAVELDDPWLHDFYKECGREVTLAYTTLNQMKNWAIVVQAAVISGVVAFGKNLAISSNAGDMAAFA